MAGQGSPRGSIGPQRFSCRADWHVIAVIGSPPVESRRTTGSGQVSSRHSHVAMQMVPPPWRTFRKSSMTAVPFFESSFPVGSSVSTTECSPARGTATSTVW